MIFPDTCSLINLGNSGLLEASLSCWVDEIAVGPVVLGECNPLLVGRLIALKDEGILTFFEDDAFSAARFLEIQAEWLLGAGETECIALAEHSNGAICCDDGKGRRVGREILGASQVTGSIGLLSHLVNSGECSPGDVYIAYCRMVDGGGFLPDLAPDFFELA